LDGLLVLKKEQAQKVQGLSFLKVEYAGWNPQKSSDRQLTPIKIETYSAGPEHDVSLAIWHASCSLHLLWWGVLTPLEGM
jgi:hypothetical protein